MPHPIDLYLDEVMRYAAIAPETAQCIREELREHLCQMCSEENLSRNPREVLAMLNEQFGNPQIIGKGIGGVKNPAGTRAKRLARRALIASAAIIIITLTLRAAVAEAFLVTSNNLQPQLPMGSRCLVFKLASEFHRGDIVVYRPADNPSLRFLAVVDKIDNAAVLTVHRAKLPPFTITREQVLGRVVANTR